ncbi:MAG: hypothetical protein HKN87_12605 [Saprospiraceae bacterium]|nr:hypothetical protein [Saprospiraceae bacterium]
MVLIHQNLYQEDNLTGVDLKDYFIKLIRGLFDSYNIRKSQIDLDIEIEDINLDVDTVIPLGLIANELISNSLKYAFQEQNKQGLIRVALKEVDDHLALTVQDNGVGIDPEQMNTLGTSFGYRLIYVLIEQLNAKIEVDSSGTSIQVIVKKYTKT